MADLSDVENEIVALLTQIIYPAGTASPSIVGTEVRIDRGWPIPEDLNAFIKAKSVMVSVYAQDNESNVTKYLTEWQELPVTAPQLVATAVGLTVTLSGTPSSPLNVAVVVNGKAYVYAVQPSDTLISIATGLVSLIEMDIACSNAGAVITIPGATSLAARVGGFGRAVNEIKRQKRGFQLAFWCPNPTIRDALVSACDNALTKRPYITLTDGTEARMRYEKSAVSDRSANKLLYRRDLFYSVEYGTTDSISAAQIVTEPFNLKGGLDPSAPPVKSFSI